MFVRDGAVPHGTVAMLARAYTYVAAAQNVKYYISGLLTLMCPMSSGFWPFNFAFFLAGYYWPGRLILDVDGIHFLRWLFFCPEEVCVPNKALQGRIVAEVRFFALEYFSYSCSSKVMVLGFVL